MNKAKVQKNIKNLKKIKEIIEISKFDTLQKLQNATKISDAYLKMAISAQELITFAKKKYRIKERKIRTIDDRTIWVYVTPDSELMSLSNAKFEKIIKKGFNKEYDSIIAIGDKAVKFAEMQSMNITYASSTSTDKEDIVAMTITTSITSGVASKVKFVINSPKVQEEAITVFPLEELNIKVETDEIMIDKKYNFYPSITHSLDSLKRIYVFRMTYALIKESQYFHLKEKLIRHEGSIKSVDSKIEEKIRDMNKINRKKETEELILVSQIAKRGGRKDE